MLWIEVRKFVKRKITMHYLGFLQHFLKNIQNQMISAHKCIEIQFHIPPWLIPLYIHGRINSVLYKRFEFSLTIQGPCMIIPRALSTVIRKPPITGKCLVIHKHYTNGQHWLRLPEWIHQGFMSQRLVSETRLARHHNSLLCLHAVQHKIPHNWWNLTEIKRIITMRWRLIIIMLNRLYQETRY